jgi:1-acyl-sn-glycerol-3-phosphate acyltransferase
VILWRWPRGEQKLIDYLGIGLVYLYARLWHRWSSNGPAPIPAKGAAILVANHTCSADPSFLTAGCDRVLSFLLAREYYHIPLLRRLLDYMGCVPVTRNARDTRSVRLALQRLSEGRVICVFPEGGLNNAGKGRIGQCKAGVALLALRSQAPVYPALIQDGPQTSNLLRSWLGPSRVRVTFGPPVDLNGFRGRPMNRRLLEEATAFIMGEIAALNHQGRKGSPHRKEDEPCRAAPSPT